MTPDLIQLRELAQRVKAHSSGKWRTGYESVESDEIVTGYGRNNRRRGKVYQIGEPGRWSDQTNDLKTYAATLCPDFVLGLLDYVETLEDRK